MTKEELSMVGFETDEDETDTGTEDEETETPEDEETETPEEDEE